TNSGLTLGRAHDETVEGGSDLDLTGQPRVRLHVVAEVEHVLFHGRGFAYGRTPRLLDVDVTGRAGASPAAFRLNARNPVLDRGFHDSRAELAIDGAGRAFVVDIGDFRHYRWREGEENFL